MKKIVSGDELRQKMTSSIHLLCGAVKKTLGPIGNNAIIDHSNFSPFITNDGVTIAKNIESDDEVQNTILELTKEASIKTDELIGDGTTSTLVLLEAIFDSGQEFIKRGKKPITLRNELIDALNKYLPLLDNYRRKPSQNELLNIAINSANDDEIGKNVYNAFLKVQNKEACFLSDSLNEKTEVKCYTGYQIETILASPYFIVDNAKTVLENALILLVNKDIINTEELAFAVNECFTKKLPLVIIANDFSENLINDILVLNFEKKCKITLLKNPEYGEKRDALLKDLAIIFNCEILLSSDYLDYKHLGKVSYLEIDKDKTIFSFSQNENIKKHIKSLKEKLAKDKDSTFIEKEIAMLTTGLVEISIGGISKTEIREKHMRYQDALCAIDIALQGICPGCGIPFLLVKERIKPKTEGEKVFWNCLSKPFQQILENAGLNYEEILDEIKKSDFNILYNVLKNKFEPLTETSVIDPIEVLKASLKNATSIASMLLTTTSLIINEQKAIYNNINDEL